MDNTKEFDIDRKLEKIIEKYRLDRHYPAYRASRQAREYIRKWIGNLSGIDKKIVFITMDDSVLWMIRGWATGENINVFWISTVEKLDDHIVQLQNADKVYIIAYARTVEILHWLWRHDFEAESIYDMLENSHIYCRMEFYRFFSPFVLSDELGLGVKSEEASTDGTALTLYEYYYQKQRLQRCGSEEDKRRLSEKLFFLAVCMRNFIEAERILKTLPCSEEYKECWQEIEALLDKMKRLLGEKKKNHIIIYWLDALSYENAGKLEYLQEQRSHSFYFHNAFTVTPITFPTFKTMFFGVRQVDDLGYQMSCLELDSSPLLQDIRKQGYDHKIISNYFNKRFEAKYSCDYCGPQIGSIPCSELFWILIRHIIHSSKPTVYLVHALMEIHSPQLSVRRDRYERKYAGPETLRAQLEELNDQLRFYDQMMGDDPYRIYMGDHGIKSIAINSLHVCFQIYHASWRNKEVDKLFCYLDFDKIMHQLLTGRKIDDTTWDREYVPIQDVDWYHPARLKKVFRRHLVDPLLTLTAYRGVVTSEYVYAYFKTGDEIFHRWSDGKYKWALGLNNLQEDSALLKELRKKVGGEFPKELDTDPKFEYSKNTYVVLKNVKETVLKSMKLLDEKFAGYMDGSIVLRPGGYHTVQLCSVLSEDSRKKVGGIVDRDPNCMCKDLGYPIYMPEDGLPDGIKAVLLSTYENLEELKVDTTERYGNTEIIDIYQYWKDCGCSFTKDFWHGLDSDWKIEFLEE